MRIEFDAVTLRYHYDEFDVLSDATFTLCESVNTVLCDIQSGKSTICKLILGNLAPTRGRVLLDGRDACKLPKSDVNALYLTDKPAFFQNKSVLYNLQYPSRVRKILKQNGETISRLAEEFGLTAVLNNKVKSLSFDQKLVLSLARGLSVKRNVVLFDGFFDDTNLEQTYPELSVANILQKFGCTAVLLTTRAEIATGNTVVLDGGKCVYCGDEQSAAKTLEQLEWLAAKI